jgi:hypothetical protein
VRLVKSGLTLQYREAIGKLSIYQLNGVKVMDVHITGDGEVDISRLSPRAYVAVAGKEQLRFMLHAQ